MVNVGRRSGRYFSLSQEPAQPVSGLRGTLNDLADAMGLPRLDEFLPTPAEFVNSLGLPTIEEILPTPKEVMESVNASIRRGVPRPVPTPREAWERFE